MCDDDVAALVVDNGAYFLSARQLQKGLLDMDYNLWKFWRVKLKSKCDFLQDNLWITKENERKWKKWKKKMKIHIEISNKTKVEK